MGIKQYIMSVKMAKAKALILEGSLPLGEVAVSVGIEDYNLFLKKFKYHEGVSPDKFRRTYYNTHLNKK
jgi:YesN/AraC family two-component response regulator